jgi:DNA-binding MarR family transcriptional regulator
MTTESVSPLNPDEEDAWRALTYVANHLTKSLGEDLARTASLSIPEYVVLVHLSEADQQQLRIGDLAAVAGLSPSRMSRLVDQMERHGMVTKHQQASDARCSYAELTDQGLVALQETYPKQLHNVRRRVFDHLTAREVKVLGEALSKIRTGIDL